MRDFRKTHQIGKLERERKGHEKPEIFQSTVNEGLMNIALIVLVTRGLVTKDLSFSHWGILYLSRHVG